jgi:hypothetical protein
MERIASPSHVPTSPRGVSDLNPGPARILDMYHRRSFNNPSPVRHLLPRHHPHHPRRHPRMRAPDRSLASVNKATSVLLCVNTPRTNWEWTSEGDVAVLLPETPPDGTSNGFWFAFGDFGRGYRPPVPVSDVSATVGAVGASHESKVEWLARRETSATQH